MPLHPTSTSGRVSRRGLIAAAPLAVAACATPHRLPAVPVDLTERAETGVPHVRYLPERDPAPFIKLGTDALARERAWLASQGHTGPMPPAAYLAISGGGGDGAFGAGLLSGWTQRGDRPAFKLVTGVSTGALIAPFAFLGSSYDPTLQTTYTDTRDSDIFRKRSPLAALFKDAMADTQPMAKLVERYVTPELMTRIAAEYAKGRLLVIGTTNLDAREPVYWDMGAIASQADEAGIRLFRQITLASAAIPGAFPPVMIDVTVDGKHYQEMHVDGGATRQVFLYPQRLRLGEITDQDGLRRVRRLYLIRNARLDAKWASVDRRTLTIVGRAVDSLIQTQGVGDLMRIYLTSTRDGVDFNLASIPSTFNTPRLSEFDQDYMRALFEVGRSMAAAGFPWSKSPPGYGPT